MSTITPMQPIPITLPSPSHVYRLTVDQYDRMVQDGTLDEHDPVELLGGVLVRKMPQNPEHVWAVDELGEVLAARQSDTWHVRKEHPVRIPDYDEPEPDLVIVRGTRERSAACTQDRRIFTSWSRWGTRRWTMIRA